MAYHPLIGIGIFLISIVLAFFIGKWAVRKGLERLEAHRAQKARLTDAASPDAPWIESNGSDGGSQTS